MKKYQKLLLKILDNASDANFKFTDLVFLLQSLGFEVRIKGSHYIFYKTGVNEIINIQQLKNNKSKPYQVKQVRNIVLKYKLGVLEND